MKLKILLSLALTCFLSAKEKHDPRPADTKACVQVALLLDTSNSMDGLINQARTQLWKVVNSFADAECEGVTPHVEVALYEYGNNTLSAETNYIRQVQPFTRDLDEVSKQLFSLTTNGGEEYCGAVIQRSLADLQWSKHSKSYKAIFIAGNEPFTQGPINAHKACGDSLRKGITVNTIHCGNRKAGIAGQWNDGAALAGGKFLIINQDQAVCHIAAPQDGKIAELNAQLNDTYIPYGRHGAIGKRKQMEADSFADANAQFGSSVQRTLSKSTANYYNASWDLIDAAKEKKFKVAKVEKKHLPKAYQNLSDAELEKKIKEVTAKRDRIQTAIKKLNEERVAFIAEEQKKQANKSEETLDQVIVQTSREQAVSKGFKFKN